MNKDSTTADDRTIKSTSRRDHGVTYVEILIAIVLLGTTVVGVLTAVRTTMVATTVDRDHAKAFEWLQAAADEVYNAARIPCHTATNASIRSAYNTAAQAADRPTGWTLASGATIEVTEVLYIGRSSSALSYSWGLSPCLETAVCSDPSVGYCSSAQTAQKVKIVARDPAGKIVKSLETVKGE